MFTRIFWPKYLPRPIEDWLCSEERHNWCSQGFSHMQSNCSLGDDRLLGTALSQTSSISALYLPRAGSSSVLFGGDVTCKKSVTFLRKQAAYLSCVFHLFVLFVMLFRLEGEEYLSYRPPTASSLFCLFHCHCLSSLHPLTLSFIYLSGVFWALLFPGELSSTYFLSAVALRVSQVSYSEGMEDDYRVLQNSCHQWFLFQGHRNLSFSSALSSTHTFTAFWHPRSPVNTNLPYHCEHGFLFFSMYCSGGCSGFTTHNHHSSSAASGLAAWVWLSNPQLELLS